MTNHRTIISCTVAVRACPRCKDPVIFGGGNIKENVFFILAVRFRSHKLSDIKFLEFSTSLGSYFKGNN